MFGRNVYGNPEKFGLEIVDFWEDESLSYGFDMLVVWKSFETERLYWAADSGCSCPTPFEDYDLSNLPRLNQQTYPEFERDAKRLGATPAELQKIRRKIRG